MLSLVSSSGRGVTRGALSALIALAGCALPAQDEDVATVESPIQGGWSEGGFRAVGELRIGYRNVNELDHWLRSCTATLIDHRVILVAASCVTGQLSRFVDGSFEAWADPIAFHPTKDLALLELENSADAQPMDVDVIDSNLRPGTTCIGVGFGSGAKRSAEELVRTTDANLTLVDRPAHGERPGLADDSDMGGPLLCGDLRSGQFPTQVSAVVHGHDPAETTHVEEQYTTVDAAWVLRELADETSFEFRTQCQDLSDRYGLSPTDFGFASLDIAGAFVNARCNTEPWSPDNCQRASELYGIASNVGYGFAPASVQTWWNNHGCWTAPLETKALCQRAADNFGIIANVTFGDAPAEVRSWWTANQCFTRPHSQSTCQHAADLYGIFVDDLANDESGFTYDFGWAPPAVQSWFVSNGCFASRRQADPCQLASDLYDIRPDNNSLAPGNVVTWYHQHGCTTYPAGFPNNDGCQRASELWGLAGDGLDTVGTDFAPFDVASLWGQSECGRESPAGFTAPLSRDLCQKASDLYGIDVFSTWGFAPPEIISWYEANLCFTMPR